MTNKCPVCGEYLRYCQASREEWSFSIEDGEIHTEECLDSIVDAEYPTYIKCKNCLKTFEVEEILD